MKAVLLSAVALFSVTAMADQCQLVTKDEASRAALLLQKGSVVTDYCEPCINGGAKVSKTSIVKTVKLVNTKVGGQVYTEVQVNGQGIDLAYSFIQVAPNKSVNIAKAVACSSLDESSVSSVIDANLNTLK